MSTRIHVLAQSRYPWGMVQFMTFAWVLIATKCTLIWWAMIHWHVPFHPAWIVVPTLIFAALATLLWLTHREE